MSDVITVEVSINEKLIEDKLTKLFNDETTMLEIHNLLAKMCDEYVPFLEGPLSQSGLAQVTAESVRYGGADVGVPYARYQYYGVGFNHTLEYHPKATAQWDKAMMAEKGELFRKQVGKILTRRAKELYG